MRGVRRAASSLEPQSSAAGSPSGGGLVQQGQGAGGGGLAGAGAGAADVQVVTGAGVRAARTRARATVSAPSVPTSGSRAAKRRSCQRASRSPPRRSVARRALARRRRSSADVGVLGAGSAGAQLDQHHRQRSAAAAGAAPLGVQQLLQARPAGQRRLRIQGAAGAHRRVGQLAAQRLDLGLGGVTGAAGRCPRDSTCSRASSSVRSGSSSQWSAAPAANARRRSPGWPLPPTHDGGQVGGGRLGLQLLQQPPAGSGPAGDTAISTAVA